MSKLKKLKPVKAAKPAKPHKQTSAVKHVQTVKHGKTIALHHHGAPSHPHHGHAPKDAQPSKTAHKLKNIP